MYNTFIWKVDAMKPNDRSCSLTLDEMSIQAKMEYDLSSQSILGGVTLPNHTGVVTHGLVFMLSSICKRWKQIVAYYFTGKILINSCITTRILEFNLLRKLKIKIN